MKQNKISSYIGFAMKSGKLASGEFSVEKAVKDGKARLVIIAKDSSGNTRKKFTDMCTYYNVPVAVFGEKEYLGHIIGKELRACISVNDAGLADAIIKNISLEDKN
jgi:ribosomal protein L7Ae-like RNA K-turn-binding protein